MEECTGIGGPLAGGSSLAKNEDMRAKADHKRNIGASHDKQVQHVDHGATNRMLHATHHHHGHTVQPNGARERQ